jgi:hypothetical protein
VQRMWPQIAAMARDLAISMLIPERRGRGVDKAAVGVEDIAGGRLWGMGTVMVTVILILIVFMMVTKDVMGDTGIMNTVITSMIMVTGEGTTADNEKGRKGRKAARVTAARTAAPAPAPVAPAAMRATMRVLRLGRSVGRNVGRGVRRCVKNVRRSARIGTRGRGDMGKMVIKGIVMVLMAAVDAIVLILAAIGGMEDTEDIMADKDITTIIMATTVTLTATNISDRLRLPRTVRLVSINSITCFALVLTNTQLQYMSRPTSTVLNSAKSRSLVQ